MRNSDPGAFVVRVRTLKGACVEKSAHYELFPKSVAD